MSYTIVRDEAAELDRLEVNLDNIIRRRCKIGKVRMKWRPQLGETFFVPPAWYPDPVSQPWPPIYVGTSTVMDHPRNYLAS